MGVKVKISYTEKWELEKLLEKLEQKKGDYKEGKQNGKYKRA